MNKQKISDMDGNILKINIFLLDFVFFNSRMKKNMKAVRFHEWQGYTWGLVWFAVVLLWAIMLV